MIEWCDRTLLARMHRYTVTRLRAEIEPVSPADFMRFLFKWQHVDAPDRLTGIDGLREVIAMLDGYELAASAWERSVLAARVENYDLAMLDMLCLAGEVAWGRLSLPQGMSSDYARLTGATPIALFLREHATAWQAGRPAAAESELRLSEAATRMLDLLRTRGASFFGDLRTGCALDDDAARSAIGSLVASGLAASDGFAGLRALVWSAAGRPATLDRRANFAGRWTAITAVESSADYETHAWTLLRRYGVVFRRLLIREAIAPPWRELARVYRRLEARGEIRGGRFVSGMSGEQFALPRAVERLREVRRTAADGRLLAISAADPLNLAGIITSGDRIRPLPRTRILYRDGAVVDARAADLTRSVLRRSSAPAFPA